MGVESSNLQSSLIFCLKCDLFLFKSPHFLKCKAAFDFAVNLVQSRPTSLVIYNCNNWDNN